MPLVRPTMTRSGKRKYYQVRGFLERNTLVDCERVHGLVSGRIQHNPEKGYAVDYCCGWIGWGKKKPKTLLEMLLEELMDS